MYKSEHGKKCIHQLYHEKLDSLGLEYEIINIDTSFGETNIIKTGNLEGPPLILVHGANGCAPIALEIYPLLLTTYSVYAVDVIGEPNLSSDKRMSKKDLMYGKWFTEVLNQLQLSEVTLVGFSLGGMVIWQNLVIDDSRIKEAFMIAPAGLVNGNPFVGIFQMLIPMKRYIKTQKAEYLHKVINGLFTEEDSFAFPFLSAVLQHFKLDFSPIQLLSKKQAKRIKKPVTLFAAMDDLLFPGEKMIKRADKIFPNLKETHLLKHSKHVQNERDNAFIQSTILRSKEA